MSGRPGLRGDPLWPVSMMLLADGTRASILFSSRIGDDRRVMRGVHVLRTQPDGRLWAWFDTRRHMLGYRSDPAHLWPVPDIRTLIEWVEEWADPDTVDGPSNPAEVRAALDVAYAVRRHPPTLTDTTYRYDRLPDVDRILYGLRAEAVFGPATISALEKYATRPVAHLAGSIPSTGATYTVGGPV